MRLAVLTPLLVGMRAVAQQPRDSLTPASVHVPAQCAGTPVQRCPLVVFPQVPAILARAVPVARAMIEWQQALADKYGTILLVPNTAAIPPGNDSLLQQTLRTYAVDPDKIALVGYRIRLGSNCPDSKMFSRVALLSPYLWDWGSPVCLTEGQPSRKVRVYLDGGLGEMAFIVGTRRIAPKLQQAGHALEPILALRGYAAGPEEFERLWRWLDESWTVPVPAASATAADDPDPGPLLTARALDQLTMFWHRFQREPDSIRTTGRLAHQQQIMVSVGTERFSLLRMDTPALAARYPSVRAALDAAGLTGRQADAYRRALILAVANRPVGPLLQPLAPVTVTSRLDTNIVFLQTHKEALKALGATGMWVTP